MVACTVTHTLCTLGVGYMMIGQRATHAMGVWYMLIGQQAMHAMGVGYMVKLLGCRWCGYDNGASVTGS